jgi:hypothetical protein
MVTSKNASKVLNSEKKRILVTQICKLSCNTRSWLSEPYNTSS